MNFLLALFIVLFVTAYIKPGNKKDNRTSLFFPLIFFCFVICLVAYAPDSFKSAQYGFYLWSNVVLPSLFPFFVFAELLRGTSLIRTIGVLFEPIMRPLFNIPGTGSFAFFMGLFSGYPVGAKVGSELYEEHLCSKEEAERLIAFCNNSSPLFITGAVAVGIFGKPELGVLLLVSHYLGCVTVGIIYGLKSRIHVSGDGSLTRLVNRVKEPSPDTKLSEAILNSINTLLMIGGYIVLFSVIVTILNKLGIIHLIAAIIKSVLFFINYAFSLSLPISAGIFEITSGTNLVKLSFAPLSQKVIIASFILGWGGLSVHAQVASIISKSGLSIKPYIIGKFLQGIFSAIYASILLRFMIQLPVQELPVFARPEYSSIYLSCSYFLNSAAACIVITSIITLLSIFLRYKEKNNKGQP